MMLLHTIALLLAAVTPSPDHGQAFRLQPGDFRWVPFTVRQTPTVVDCHYEVLQGNPSVHVELLPMTEFRLFDRGREHSTIAITPDGRTGDFRRMIVERGQYAVLVLNQKGAPPATVSLQMRTNANPGAADVARTLPPQRRLVVILISFVFFFTTVTWSGRKLIHAMRDR